MNPSRKERREYENTVFNNINTQITLGEQTDFDNFKRDLSEQVIWTKEIDPDFAVAGMDCTRYVPEKPAWHGKIIGEPFDHSVIRFNVPRGKTPKIGGDYVDIQPMDWVADAVYSAKEGIKKYFSAKVLPFLKQKYAVQIK